MEEADAVDLSKENIQPLKQGRNASILGLALQAQTDEQIHHQLLKMQEAYEVKIRSYSGPDPLALWVEYISWVEQCFPKHGLEGKLEVLLQKCFSALKDEERYKQDLRFVKLWIKFIEMQTNDRLELYRFLSGQEIGTACAEFYRSWAYEFEQLEDYKHADAVYQLAYTNMAQPITDLEAAHTQFQLRVARAVLHNQINNTQDPEQNPEGLNQRSAMSSLCPVGPKHNKVGVVRVGSNVLSANPGTLHNPAARPTLLGQSNSFKGHIPIYQEESSDSLGVLGKGRSSAPSTSVHGVRNKENCQGAGTWNKPGAVRSKIPPQVAVFQPQPTGPSFQVHRDEVAADAPATPSLKAFTPNVLKPRKVEENAVKETLAVYEQQDPTVQPMYPKDKIYGGSKELQLEEIMAIEHWKEKAKESGQSSDPVEQERLRLEQIKRKLEEEKNAIEDKLRLLSGKPVARQVDQPGSDVEHAPLQQLLLTADTQVISQSFGLPETRNQSTGSASQSESKGSISFGQESRNASSTKSVENRSINSLNVLLTPGDAPISSNNSNASELSLDKKKEAFGSGNRGHTSIYNQSMTVHTKLAMHEVDDLWRSPNPIKFPESPAAFPPRQNQPDESVMAFNICRDETEATRALQQPGLPRLPLSALKATAASVLNDGAGPKSCDPPRALPDDPEESLAHVLGPDCSSESIFKEPVVAPLRSSLKQGVGKDIRGARQADDKFRNPLVSSSQEARNSVGIFKSQTSGFQIFGDEPTSGFAVFKEPEGDIPIFKEPQADIPIFKEPEVDIPIFKEPQANISIFKEPEVDIPIFKEPQADIPIFKEPEVDIPIFKKPDVVIATFREPEADKADFQFDVFVDEQEAKLPAEAARPVTPGNKLSVIAKEKENAQKFSLVEIEEIEKKPMAPPRRSILPQLNNHYDGAGPFKDNALRRDPPPPFPEDDDTCSTKVFSGGLLAASTPFTGIVSRNNAPDFDLVSRELNGSLFVSTPSEEMVTPSITTLKEPRADDNQLSTIYEVSISSNRTSSSQSASSGACTVSSGIADQENTGAFVSTQPNLDMIDEVNEDMAGDFTEPYHDDVTVSRNGEVDPFDKLVVNDLLNKLRFPQEHHRDGFVTALRNVPMKRNDIFALENENFKVVKQLGEGSYAKVWQVVEERTKRHVALKIQKPSWQWEFYICREIQIRLENKDLASSFMHAEKMFVYNNGSVLLTELVPYGTLIDITNKLNRGNFSVKRESLVIILADHLLRVIEALHSCLIIHGDMKPDNVLIRSIPTADSKDSCVMLIDFGRSIDMSLFPPGTTFQRNVKTDGFSCVEMLTNRPWTYQTDLYGLASSVHCLLLGKYLKVREVNGRWQLQESLPRSSDKERWTNFFSSLLNVESCRGIPDLKVVRENLLQGHQFRERDFEDLEKLIRS